MILVATELGPLAFGCGIFEGQRVQPELVGHDLQLLQIRSEEIHPDDRVLMSEMIVHVVQREALVVEHARPVTPCLGHPSSITHPMPPLEQDAA